MWFAEATVPPDYTRPLYGIEACCRTSVVYCPTTLSCYWELDQPHGEVEYPPEIQREIEAVGNIGQNVIAYATNRDVQSKLNRPQVTLATGAQLPKRGVLAVPKLTYRGGGDDAPNALPNLLQFVQENADLRVRVENQLIAPQDDDLQEYPLLYMHGRRAFRFSPTQRTRLREYFQRGGCVIVDSICASADFAASVRQEFEAILIGHSFRRIPSTHPLFSTEFHGYDLSRVTLRDPVVRRSRERLDARLTTAAPLLETIELDGRMAVIFSPYDLSCALEYSASLECKGYVKQDAARIGLNVILYALQQ